MASRISPDALTKLQANPSHVRNLCIIAHVDHGKTTLTDCLISSNGIISAKLAGRVRYMDSTEEEQLRGITMKSSAIALLHYDEPQRELRPKFKAQMDQFSANQKAAAEAATTSGGSPPPAAAAAEQQFKVPYLINLIDSPGHVDFSMDVATAARLCDGALVVVDALEGVCIQTHAVLRTAWGEGVRPVLVLNKIDRLIVELQQTPLEAYHHLCRILEQMNVIMSELLAADLMAGLTYAPASSPADAPSSSGGEAAGEAAPAGSSSSFETQAIDVDERAEARIFFDPSRGNVVFASAADGWAFTLDDFAALHAPKLGVPRAQLRRALWGDYYVRPLPRGAAAGGGPGGLVPRTLVNGAREPAAVAAASGKPLAVSLMLERLWAVYAALQTEPDEARAARILSSLSLQVPKRDLAVKDPRSRLQAVMRAWLPLHATVLGTVARGLPSPAEAQAARLPKLWPALAAQGAGAGDGASASASRPPLSPSMTLEQRLERVRWCIEHCDASPDADVVVFVAKMFAVPRASLPQPPQQLAEAAPPPAAAAAAAEGSEWWGSGALLHSPGLDLRGINSPSRQRDALARKQAKRRAAAGDFSGGGPGEAEGGAAPSSTGRGVSEIVCNDGGGGGDYDDDADADIGGGDQAPGGSPDASSSGVETFVAFARVFSGVLRPDSRVFVLGPKYSPFDASAGDCAHVSRLAPSAPPLPLYMMMGRDLLPMGSAPAGSVVGIGRLGAHVLKTATLCSTPACVSLSPMVIQTTPLVRVAVEPKLPRDQAALERGLALLNQADPCVEVSVADTGELQLSALGELHLDRCLKDLSTRFARCEISVSAPILSFHETIIEAPTPVPAPATALGPGDLHGPGSGAFFSDSAAAWAHGAWVEGEPPPSRAAAAAQAHHHQQQQQSSSGAAAGSPGAQQHGPSSPAAPSGPVPEFGKAYGSAAFPWSWRVPESGAAYHPPSASVFAFTPDRSVVLRLRAVPLPPDIAALLLASAPHLHALASEKKRVAATLARGAAPAAAQGDGSAGSGASHLPAATALFLERLRGLFSAAGGDWPARFESIWAFGPKRCGANILVCADPAAIAQPLASRLVASDAAGSAGLAEEIAAAAIAAQSRALAPIWSAQGGAGPSLLPEEAAGPAASAGDGLRAEAEGLLGAQLALLRSSIQQGFQLATAAGPLCGEPMWGVAFLLEEARVVGSSAQAEAQARSSAKGVAAAAAAASAVSAAAAAAEAAAAGAVASGAGAPPPFKQQPQHGERAGGSVAGPPLAEFAADSCGDGDAASTGSPPTEPGIVDGATAVGAAFVDPLNSPLSTRSEPTAAVTAGAVPSRLSLSALSSGQVIAATRDACRLAFQAGKQRLVEAIFRCELQCSGGRGGGASGEQLGRLYGVLSRRRARVLAEDVWEGTQTFVITALLPVVESFGFADDLRKQTSGAATAPQLLFSHWEVLDVDPFFRPKTEAEREEWGDTLHEGQGRNIAREFVDAVRARKGMPVERKVVEHAEKQRTLSRKK